MFSRVAFKRLNFLLCRCIKATKTSSLNEQFPMLKLESLSNEICRKILETLRRDTPALHDRLEKGRETDPEVNLQTSHAG